MDKKIHGGEEFSPVQTKIIDALKGAFGKRARIGATPIGLQGLDLNIAKPATGESAFFIIGNGKITSSTGNVNLIDEASEIIREALGNNPHEPLQTIVVNGKYRHWKGGYYRVICESTHTETEEEFVVYRACGDYSGITWSRPKKLFMDGRFHFVPED